MTEDAQDVEPTVALVRGSAEWFSRMSRLMKSRERAQAAQKKWSEVLTEVEDQIQELTRDDVEA